MKKTIFLAMIMLGIMPVASAVNLNQILYDPVGPDYGFEFIELYNPSDEFVDLSNFKLFKTNSGEWDEIWSGSNDYIPPKGFYSIGENNSFDYMTDLRLQNNKGGVRLVGPNVDENITWGDLPFTDTLNGIPDGNSFFRVKYTNPPEWYSGKFMLNENPELITINVKNAPPVIVDYSVFSYQGNVSLQIQAEDDNGIEEIIEAEIVCDEETLVLSFSESMNFQCEAEEIQIRLFDSIDYSEWETIQLDSEIFEIISFDGCDIFPGEVCNISIEILAKTKIEVSFGIDSLFGPSGELIVNSEQTIVIENQEKDKILLEFIIPKGVSSGSYRGISDLKVVPIN